MTFKAFYRLGQYLGCLGGIAYLFTNEDKELFGLIIAGIYSIFWFWFTGKEFLIDSRLIEEVGK